MKRSHLSCRLPVTLLVFVLSLASCELLPPPGDPAATTAADTTTPVPAETDLNTSTLAETDPAPTTPTDPDATAPSETGPTLPRLPDPNGDPLTLVTSLEALKALGIDLTDHEIDRADGMPQNLDAAFFAEHTLAVIRPGGASGTIRYRVTVTTTDGKTAIRVDPTPAGGAMTKDIYYRIVLVPLDRDISLSDLTLSIGDDLIDLAPTAP